MTIPLDVLTLDQLIPVLNEADDARAAAMSAAAIAIDAGSVISATGLIYGGNVAGRTVLGLTQNVVVNTINVTLPLSGRVIPVYQITLSSQADTGVY